MVSAADASAELIDAIDALIESTDANIARSREIRRRLKDLRRHVARGASVAEIVESEPRPLVVELITQNLEMLHTDGAQLRWAQASALRQEGLTITAIAEMFGVTRQRVSALLQSQDKTAE